jgi:hypothetical protein
MLLPAHRRNPEVGFLRFSIQEVLHSAGERDDSLSPIISLKRPVQHLVRGSQPQTWANYYIA